MTTLRHHTESDALVLTPDGPITSAEVPSLVAVATRVLHETPAGAVMVDLLLIRRPGLATIDVLLRLHLIARRHGRALRVRHAPAALDRTLLLTGLRAAVPLDRPCTCRVCSSDRDVGCEPGNESL